MTVIKRNTRLKEISTVLSILQHRKQIKQKTLPSSLLFSSIFCHSSPCILISLQYLLVHVWELLVIQHQEQMKLDVKKCKAMHTKRINLSSSLLGLEWTVISSGKTKQKKDLCISMESSTKTLAQWVSVIKTTITLFAYMRKRMENNRKNIPNLLYKSIVLFNLATLCFFT